jgi:hypothetical protein
VPNLQTPIAIPFEKVVGVESLVEHFFRGLVPAYKDLVPLFAHVDLGKVVVVLHGSYTHGLKLFGLQNASAALAFADEGQNLAF